MTDGEEESHGALRRMFSRGMDSINKTARRFMWADEDDSEYGYHRTNSGTLAKKEDYEKDVKQDVDDEVSDDDEATKLRADTSQDEERKKKRMKSLTDQAASGCLCCKTPECLSFMKPKSKARPKRSGGRNKRNKAGVKMECQYTIGIEQDEAFNVKSRIIGKAGANVKEVVNEANKYDKEGGTKLRLRGRGSDFIETDKDGVKRESSDPMMLCVSATNQDAYDEARRRIEALLGGIYAEWQGLTGQSIQFDVHEGKREGGL